MVDYDLAGIPERLKAFRKERGLTQTELAERCGFVQPAITRWETGGVELSLPNAVRLCKALDVSLDQLCGRIDR
ncbi:MAG: helix-turn-helix transcriptional regulator [Gemmatimonadetes bacterium]|nr:helix-turn-helix transcriptional regulator [Gemmatimonadota bacterium]MYJ09141.1 helix-turn-helix transcriptional regulator [Gemmatimonadota bacterium]